MVLRKVDSLRKSRGPGGGLIRGGTVIWCPECQYWRPCRAVPAAMITGNLHDYGQRWENTSHASLRWFQRGRLCQHCGAEFLTAEIDISVLIEMEDLRERLAKVEDILGLFSQYRNDTVSRLRYLANKLEELDCG